MLNNIIIITITLLTLAFIIYLISKIAICSQSVKCPRCGNKHVGITDFYLTTGAFVVVYKCNQCGYEGIKIC